MREVEFKIPNSAQLSEVDSAIEAICAAEGLQTSMKGTLVSFPGSTHWHFKRPGERGTLELTVFPARRRIWASIQDGRRASWIEPCLASIQQSVEAKLKESTRLLVEN
jgi:hypothetical protein